MVLLAEPARVQAARAASMPQIRKLFAGMEYPPRQDRPIQELYVIASDARAAGARLPVHIFPGRN